ncbi:glycosyltransferase [Oscillatoria sp. CS-180]|uniref:glycosyltransferase n=1 Tax=Oscillatoria sp. CS-180 TaxID=3021720 RepID=UPI00232B710F|nr:glycosyltransferase [Oscillatoria sp. CS-180]MDB9527350.1 glycosyltransferase [Oscillatoria sp. CS-180]
MQTSARKKIALWQPYFLGGGAEAVALWTLQALLEDYDVTLHTLSPVDFGWLDKMYCTQLADKSIHVQAQLPNWWASSSADFLLSNNQQTRVALIYWSIRCFKQVAHQYDVAFSTFNALDMGVAGMQYLHWVHVLERYPDQAKPLQNLLMKWTHFSHEQLAENFSIANSQFTADRVEKAYGIKSQVVFPPVTTEIVSQPWEQKENAFLCSGRIVEAKQTHRAITILRAIRDKGFDVKLHITGGGGGVYANGYVRKVQKLARENADWVFLHQNLAYQDYLKVVASCRYGIHYKPEPFGISIAEMLKADMIPFVRSVGGQVEIVGAENAAILFANEPEAIERIANVLRNEALQVDLRRSLHQRKQLFSTERFMDEIRSKVDQYLSAGADLSPLPLSSQ